MFKKAAMGIIRFYQNYLSPLSGPKCRYYPTCSHYTLEAIDRYGFFLGGAMGTLRILRCNPLFPGGVDPVPELKYKKRRRK